ncbi:hypothetical protein [Sorangium sp. So ce1000]|uniref:hypothetical protein n=1 Tax=Sorangium sp. So ce1000 TaxID=3133325 RepID=UPI003F606D06
MESTVAIVRLTPTSLAALAPEQGAPRDLVVQPSDLPPSDLATHEALAQVAVAFSDDGGHMRAARR